MTASTAALIASQPPEVRAAILADLTDSELEALEHDWRFWARPEQIAPDGDWQHWLFIAGRGAGKTRSGAEWVRGLVKSGYGLIGLIAPTAGDARDVMVEGESGLLGVCKESDRGINGDVLGRPLYEPSKRRVTWANGAQATLFSAEEPERLRGPQHAALWMDELAAWNRARETYDMAMFGLRLGDDPRVMVTTTPKPVPLLRELMKDPHNVVTRGTTYDNAANLAPGAVEQMRRRYEGTRLGRQELNAEMLDDLPGALWTRDAIDVDRASRESLPDMARIVVAIDPSGVEKASDEGDNQGIVVAGLGVDGRGYVLADRSCKLSPDGWARRAVAAYHEFKADRLVAEKNYGGGMVKNTILTVDPTVSYKSVHADATRGKVVRAEPVSALYEQHKISHAGSFPELEDQMCQFGRDGYVGEGSPDRVDALVWALTELMLGRKSDFEWSFNGASY